MHASTSLAATEDIVDSRAPPPALHFDFGATCLVNNIEDDEAKKKSSPANFISLILVVPIIAVISSIIRFWPTKRTFFGRAPSPPSRESGYPRKLYYIYKYSGRKVMPLSKIRIGLFTRICFLASFVVFVSPLPHCNANNLIK
jgi:hypothetical protein